MRAKSEREPMRCEVRVIILTSKCSCGFEVTKSRGRSSWKTVRSRSTAATYSDLGVSTSAHDTIAIWKRIYYRSRNTKRTFRQAVGLFVHENGY